MSGTRKVTHDRHFDVRQHQTFEVEVPEAMLTDPTYFVNGAPTLEFDQWVCDNGEEVRLVTDSLDQDNLDIDTTWDSMMTTSLDDRENVDFATEDGEIRFTIHAYTSHIDGARVVQIDTGEHVGPIRVYVNDGAVFDADPEA